MSAKVCESPPGYFSVGIQDELADVGSVAAASETPDPSDQTVADVPQLVPAAVTKAKLRQELADWRASEGVYRRRGWLMLGADIDARRVDVGFIANVPVTGAVWPVITAAIRVTYDNYDLWPPSVSFIDPASGSPAMPPVQAPDTLPSGEVRNVLLPNPNDGTPFLCLPGIREYHQHPQHTGDDWLLHRAEGAGRLAVICDRVWRRMARNVVGVAMHAQTLPDNVAQLQVQLAQGEWPPVNMPGQP